MNPLLYSPDFSYLGCSPKYTYEPYEERILFPENILHCLQEDVLSCGEDCREDPPIRLLTKSLLYSEAVEANFSQNFTSITYFYFEIFEQQSG